MSDDRAGPRTPQQRAAELRRERSAELLKAQQQQREADERRARMDGWLASYRPRWQTALNALAAKLPKDGDPFRPLSVADLDGELRAVGRLMAERDCAVEQDRRDCRPGAGAVEHSLGHRPWFDPDTATVNRASLLPGRLESFAVLRVNFDDPAAADAALLLLDAYGDPAEPIPEPTDPRAFGWLLTLASLSGVDHIDFPPDALRLFDPANPRYPAYRANLPSGPLVWGAHMSQRDSDRAECILRPLWAGADTYRELFPAQFEAAPCVGPAVAPAPLPVAPTDPAASGATQGKGNAPAAPAHTAQVDPLPTGSTLPRRKPPPPPEQRERLVREAIDKRMRGAGSDKAKRIVFAAAFTLDDIAKDTELRRSTAGETVAWTSHAAKFPKKGRTPAKPKAHRPLTAKILAARPDPSARTPDDELVDREDVEARYRSACSPAELARFEAMTPAERSQALALLAEQLDDDFA